MIVIMEPTAFLCPGCNGPIYDDWYPSDYIYHLDETPAQEYWSDNVSTRAWKELRSLVSCPLCSAIFPYHPVKAHLAKPRSRTPEALSPTVPFVQVQIKQPDYSSVEANTSHVLSNPDMKSWKLAGTSGELNKEFDFIFRTLIAESILQSFNDELRPQVLRLNIDLVSELSPDLEPYIYRYVKDLSRIEVPEGERSAWATTELWEYMGIARFNLLAAELERFTGRYEQATERLLWVKTHLRELEESLTEDELDEQKIDHCIEYEDEPSQYNWDFPVTYERIERSLEMAANERSGLFLVKIIDQLLPPKDWFIN